MKTIRLLFLASALMLTMAQAFAHQENRLRFGVGGLVLLDDNTVWDNIRARGGVRGFVRYDFSHRWEGEAGLSYGSILNVNKEVSFLPLDARMVYNLGAPDVTHAYLYGGLGLITSTAEDLGTRVKDASRINGQLALGIGAHIKLSSQLALEATLGENLMTDKAFNGIRGGMYDGYWSLMLGVSLGGESETADSDGDGLSNLMEKQIGTDPRKSDSDGDRLSDGYELNTVGTNPLLSDTDNDGLSDYDEVNLHQTDPLKADSDGDGLPDGDEVLRYHTDPMKADTDGDGLNDPEETRTHKTDPLKRDTDGGGIGDAEEIRRGTNPLDAGDDVAKETPIPPAAAPSNEAATIVLTGCQFGFNSAALTSEAEQQLEQTLASLKANPFLEIEIQGHADSVGSRSANERISVRRAEAVKNWLITKGIAAQRLATKGYGSSNPVASNATDAGRRLNRRVEIVRIR